MNVFSLAHSCLASRASATPSVASRRPIEQKTAPRLGRWSMLVSASIALWQLIAVTNASACSIPVFRFALERWEASSYELLVFHRGKLSAEEQARLDSFKAKAASPDRTANVSVRTVDLAGNPAPELLELWKQQKSEALPAMLLRYPRGAAVEGDVWSGPLNEAALQQVLDSPVRRQMTQRLLKGDTGVWVLLESGDRVQDDAAAELLQKRIEHLQKTLQLPTIEPEDVEKYRISGAGELKVAFSLLRVARTDPAEEVFVRALLRSEDDLEETTEPIAFPVFGRARSLFALVGKGINNETIDEACSFLVGPCSCIVKELNPGQDLLVAAHWGAVRRDEPIPGAESLESTRAEGAIAGQRVAIASGTAASISKTPPVAPATNVSHIATAGTGGLSAGTVLVGTGLAVVLLCGGFWLLARRTR